MKDKIILGETPSGARVELDLQELITGRTLLCSISRYGKTWTARRIVEQSFGKTGIIIVDVEGEYATLRDKFPLLIIGKDVPLVPESAEFLADQVLEHDLSCIIDGSDPQLDVAAFQEFLARFIDRFIAIETKARKPYLWILEEADELAPETGIARSICLGQIRKLVKKGGKRGLGTIVLTQRPAFVSKFVISQCLPSGESVITESGLRPIEGVRVGDLVLTHRGRFRAVTQTFSRPYQGELLRVKTKGWNKATRVTPGHPFLTRSLASTSTGRPVLQRLAQLQWLEASKLTKQVYIVFPRLLETKDRELVTINYSYNNRGGRAPHLCHKTLILPVDENLMRVIGYYIAEGSLRRFRAPTARAIRWTFGKGPMEETYAKQLQIALGKLGFKARLDLVLGCYHVSVASTGLANWLEENFGAGAPNKKIPVWIKHLPIFELQWLLEAYVDGDGHRVKQRPGQWNLTTVSRQLAVDLRDIVLRIGRRAFIYEHAGKPEIQGRRVKAKPTFLINVSPPASLGNGQGLTPLDEVAIYLKTTDIATEWYSGSVYNLEVEEDNSYCTMFHTLHNCPNKIIGRTEWPDDLAVLRKFGRIPKKYADPESKDQHALKNLEKGQFYVAGDFVAKDTLVKVGPVETKHLGATPEIIPPAPKELKEVLAQLSEKLPTIIQEKLAPAVPKVAEIEARLREKFEAQWQARLGRKEKELSGVKNRLESKYETEIADLKRRLEEAVRQAAVKGPVADLLSHPLVQKNLEKLNAKQRSLIELLEVKGPQDPEHCSLFLEIGPKNVPSFVYKINSRIPKLIENLQGRYASRLAKLFPVTEEAKAEARETEDLRAQLNGREAEIIDLKRRIELIVDERTKLERSLNEVLKEKIELSKQLNALQPKPATSETPHPAGKEVEKPKSQDAIGVDVTLRRVVTSFKVAENKEILDVDESSWEGKILARGLEGFFQEPKGIGKIMAELVRRYNVGDSGGNRTTVNDRLAMLVSKGILDRKQEAGQWVYSATPEFSERVKNGG